MPENIKNWFGENPGNKYCVFMIVVIVFSNCFMVNADFLKVLLTVFYYLVSIMFMSAMFKAPEDQANIAAALTLPALMLLTLKSILFVAVTGILLFYIKSKKRRIIQYFAFCLYIFIFGVIGLLAFVFSDAVKITNQEIPSPNREYIVIVSEADQGALGGSVTAVVKKNRPIILAGEQRRIYQGRWGSRPNILWIDNKTIGVNGGRIKVNESITLSRLLEGNTGVK